MDSALVENNASLTRQHPIAEASKIYDLRFPASISTNPISTSPLRKNYNRIFKRSFDIIISGILILAILSWLIPLLAILIKLDSRGPVFFRQKRNREGGKLFTCFKFRTMVVNKEADWLPAYKNDHRITRLGKFLRNRYLDELPQCFNVLMGDMSIVGPRPHMISDNLKYEKLISNYSARHDIKPGITGLAQVKGYDGHIHNLTTLKARVKMDIFYMQHWSAKLDLAILYRTIFKSFGI